MNEHAEQELDLINAQLDAMQLRFDTRLLAAMLMARGAKLYQALIAAGQETEDSAAAVYIECWDMTKEPREKAPAVIYTDGGEVLGRKQ